MSGETITPNMNLIVPAVGVTLGPQYAVDVNNSLLIVDGHDHSPGYGVPVTPSGLNINSDLSFQNHNLTLARTLRMAPFTSPDAPTDPTDLGCLYVIDDDLYYTDEAGNVIRITESGNVAGTPGSISGLVAPASASYNSGAGKFVWQSNTNTSADMDFGSAILRNNTPGSFGLTLAPPTLSSNYTITLFTLPASLKILRSDNSGNMSATLDVDNSTIEISSNNLQVKDLGITTAKIANGAITNTQVNASASIAYSKLNLSNSIVNADINTAADINGSKLADTSVPVAKLAASNYVFSADSANFATAATGYTNVTNLSNAITTHGRGVKIFLTVPPVVGLTNFGVNTDGTAYMRILRDGVNTVVDFPFPAVATAGGGMPGVIFYDVPAAGGHSYIVQTKQIGGSFVAWTSVSLVTVED